MNSDFLLTFLLTSFALAGVVILKKDAIPPRVRRPLAILSLVMVVTSFVMLVMAFLRLGA